MFTNSKLHVPPGGIRAALAARRARERAAVRGQGTPAAPSRRLHATRLQRAQQQRSAQRPVPTRHQTHQVRASAFQECGRVYSPFPWIYAAHFNSPGSRCPLLQVSGHGVRCGSPQDRLSHHRLPQRGALRPAAHCRQVSPGPQPLVLSLCTVHGLQLLVNIRQPRKTNPSTH